MPRSPFQRLVSRCSAALVASCFALTAAAQFSPQVKATDTGAPPSPFRVADDGRDLLPADMPPLDQIPPMPMPFTGLDDPTRMAQHMKADGTVTIFDAESGHSLTLPARFPSGMAGGEGPGSEGASGLSEDERSLVEAFSAMTGVDESLFPWRMNVKLAMRFTTQAGGTAWFVCSGVMIDVNTVLTAAHCVYARNPNGINIFNWADVIYVFPGWDGNNPITPPNGAGNNQAYNHYGFASGTFYLAGTDYINNGNFDRDGGLIRLRDRAVGALTGWYGWAWGFSCNTIQSRTYHNPSYPSENCGGGLHTGRDMYYWYGSIDSCPGNQLQINTTAGCFTALWGGQSGSGLYYFNDSNLRVVHGVASNSNRTTSGRYCKLWEQFVNDMNGSFIPGSRGATFDLQALDANFPSNFIQAGAFTGGGNFLAVNPTNNNPPNRTYTFRVYLSTNDLITSGDTLIGTSTFNWDFGAVSWVTVNMPSFQIPANTPQGVYYLGVILDPDTDTNSSNNATNAWDAVRVTIGPAVPANDACGQATLVTLGTYQGSTATATQDGVTTCGSSTTTRDVWYRFVAPATGTLTAETCGSNYDTVLSLHTGCPGTVANTLACNDDACGLQSRIIQNVTEGQTVLIRVSGFNGANGAFTLTLSMPPPANDPCAGAITLVPGVAATGSTRLASVDGSATCGASANAPDVWFTFVAPGDGIAVLHTCGSAYDTVLSLHTECPGSTDDQIACNDDAQAGPCSGTLQSYIAAPVQGGRRYSVRVSGFNGRTGSYTLNLSFLAPTNDECAGAAEVFAGSTPFHNGLATNTNMPEPICIDVGGDTQVQRDLWFRYLPTCRGRVFINTCGSQYDTKLAAYIARRCPTAGSADACNDDSCGLQSEVVVTASPSAFVYIRVGGYNGRTGAGVLNIRCVPDCPADFNDDGFVDFFDFQAYVDCFEDIECPPGKDADFNNDGFVDFFDFQDFVDAFERGC
ncbi:MAG: trypsin-like serine protease [Phycisphaeraceae bacterium]|nr:MAG: trypsin-like serine protease [Phycisphaeraceae bacterium]